MYLSQGHKTFNLILLAVIIQCKLYDVKLFKTENSCVFYHSFIDRSGIYGHFKKWHLKIDILEVLDLLTIIK